MNKPDYSLLTLIYIPCVYMLITLLSQSLQFLLKLFYVINSKVQLHLIYSFISSFQHLAQLSCPVTVLHYKLASRQSPELNVTDLATRRTNLFRLDCISNCQIHHWLSPSIRWTQIDDPGVNNFLGLTKHIRLTIKVTLQTIVSTPIVVSLKSWVVDRCVNYI